MTSLGVKGDGSWWPALSLVTHMERKNEWMKGFLLESDGWCHPLSSCQESGFQDKVGVLLGFLGLKAVIDSTPTPLRLHVLWSAEHWNVKCILGAWSWQNCFCSRPSLKSRALVMFAMGSNALPFSCSYFYATQPPPVVWSLLFVIL
jgi:hypothetical protein